jgi:hypothetical protein
MDIDRFFKYLNYDFFKEAKWELKFTYMPHRCCFSNRLIWLKYGYRGKAQNVYENFPEIRWATIEDLMINKLKGTN